MELFYDVNSSRLDGDWIVTEQEQWTPPPVILTADLAFAAVLRGWYTGINGAIISSEWHGTWR